MDSLSFSAPLRAVGPLLIVKVPADIDALLPIRGMMMAEGLVNGQPVIIPIEPDGRGGHWMDLTGQTGIKGCQAGDEVSVAFTLARDWPEPPIPQDMQDAIHRAGLADTWDKLTTRARWEWLRWTRSTNNRETYDKRLAVAVSKMKSGMRRPCCFNTAGCTVPEVTKSGKLIDN